MKRIILCLATFGVMSSTAFAQTTSTKVDKVINDFRFSLSVGPNFNTLKPANATSDNFAVTKNGSNTGFGFGFNAEKYLNSSYILYTGLGLESRGGGINSVANTYDTTNHDYLRAANVKYKLQYLSVPLGLKLKAAQFDKIKVYVQTGVDLGLLISQKGQYNEIMYNGVAVNSVNNVKLKDNAKAVPVDFGWCIGAGGEYMLNSHNSVFLTLLYRNGILDHTSPKSNAAGFKFNDGNIRSNTFAVRVGYYF